jgi:cytochrome c-type biogenesis protein CcsB
MNHRICIAAAFLLLTALAGFAAPAGAVDFNEWGLLAIQDGGRRKPMDTFARETLMRLAGKSALTAAGRDWTANDFLLSMLLETHDWNKEPVILIGYKPLVQQLGLDASRKRFSFEDLSAVQALKDLALEAQKARQANAELSRTQKEVDNVASRMQLFHHLAEGTIFLIVPPKREQAGSRWALPTQLAEIHGENSGATALEHLRGLAQAYIAGDAFKFSLNAHALRVSLRALSPDVYPSERELKTEVFYNRLDPFQWAELLYGVAFVGLWIAHAARGKKPWAGAMGLMAAVAGVLFHGGGITLRCIIAGRPPVTNMYESVVWVSFGVIAFAFAFYFRYRTFTYLLAALPASAVCLILLRQLPVAMPPNIDPLVPVLRSNFWLTIHVLTITLSYAAFLLAMAFGHIVLWRFIRDPENAPDQVTLHFWLYRVIQLGVLLLAAGTILGGVWANYSWGRFWGWDPKETWALIALLCYLVVLHGRVAEWWDQFGLAVASVVCFCAVLMTWYGVNFVLGKGLHSYGFGLGGESYVAGFIVLDLAYVATAAIRYARSRPAREAAALVEQEPAKS